MSLGTDKRLLCTISSRNLRLRNTVALGVLRFFFLFLLRLLSLFLSVFLFIPFSLLISTYHSSEGCFCFLFSSFSVAFFRDARVYASHDHDDDFPGNVTRRDANADQFDEDLENFVIRRRIQPIVWRP